MSTSQYYDLVVVGGGAAGFFAAIQVKTLNPSCKIIILEAAPEVLGKVKISGGGRCNVMHHCFDVNRLVEYYPRGQQALKSVFQRFGPNETKEWFESHGVKLKTEADNRMFPITDNAQTIIDVLLNTAIQYGIDILTRFKATSITQEESGFKITGNNNNTFYADKLLLAPGSSTAVWENLQALGHKIIPPVPSLFTFKINDRRIQDLQGISFPMVKTKLIVQTKKFKQEGPLLITHWGLSGPAILKLSAWGARALFENAYQGTLEVDFVPELNEAQLHSHLKAHKQTQGKKFIANAVPLDNFPKRYWHSLLDYSGIDIEKLWSELPDKQLQKIIQELKYAAFNINGKGVFKDEFVTAGGVDLKEIDFKSMQSKKTPNLYFAGEVIDVDALTGGFNFQNAWSTGWIAGTAIGNE